MDTPKSQKSVGREVAENIARLHGKEPVIVGPVKMIGTEAVETFVKGLLDATANAHKGPPLQIRATV